MQLILDVVDIRWSSTHAMIERALFLELVSLLHVCKSSTEVILLGYFEVLHVR